MPSLAYEFKNLDTQVGGLEVKSTLFSRKLKKSSITKKANNRILVESLWIVHCILIALFQAAWRCDPLWTLIAASLKPVLQAANLIYASTYSHKQVETFHRAIRKISSYKNDADKRCIWSELKSLDKLGFEFMGYSKNNSWAAVSAHLPWYAL